MCFLSKTFTFININTIFNFCLDSNSYWSIKSGDHFEFMCGNNIDNMVVRHIKIYEHFKTTLEQLKETKCKFCNCIHILFYFEIN